MRLRAIHSASDFSRLWAGAWAEEVVRSLVALGIDRAAQEAQTYLRYIKDNAQALQAARAPDVQAVFLMNPTPVDDRSIANGRQHYQINCAVCHGNAGDGKGGLVKVNPAYAFAPSLLTPSALGRSDGYLYGMMRNGRGVMPNYNRIEEADRWDVVNYVRALQGKTTIKADTTPSGIPGQNGTTVPGPSQSAPTLPSKFGHPTVMPTPGSPNINSATYKGAEKAPEGASKEKHE